MVAQSVAIDEVNGGFIRSLPAVAEHGHPAIESGIAQFRRNGRQRGVDLQQRRAEEIVLRIAHGFPEAHQPSAQLGIRFCKAGAQLAEADVLFGRGVADGDKLAQPAEAHFGRRCELQLPLRVVRQPLLGRERIRDSPHLHLLEEIEDRRH